MNVNVFSKQPRKTPRATNISIHPHFLQPSYSLSLITITKPPNLFFPSKPSVPPGPFQEIPPSHKHIYLYKCLSHYFTLFTKILATNMDVQRKTTTTIPHHKGIKGKGKRKGGGDESLKVVYISSPMKVRTSVARFRSLVHQLTGKHSDIGPYLDCDEGALVGFRDEDGTLLPDRVFSSLSNSNDTSTATPATSDSFLGTVDSAFATAPTEDRFGGFFSLDSFSDGSRADVLGSYDDLIM